MWLYPCKIWLGARDREAGSAATMAVRSRSAWTSSVTFDHARKARRAYFAVAVGCCALTFTVRAQTAGCIAGQHEDAEGACVVCEPDTYSTTIGATECKPPKTLHFPKLARPQFHALPAPLPRSPGAPSVESSSGQTPTSTLLAPIAPLPLDLARGSPGGTRGGTREENNDDVVLLAVEGVGGIYIASVPYGWGGNTAPTVRETRQPCRACAWPRSSSFIYPFRLHTVNITLVASHSFHCVLRMQIKG